MSRYVDKPYHHGNLKSALLAAAETLLEMEGPGALSFRKLAEAVGVSHAAPRAHFSDRSALDATLAAQGFRQLNTRLGSSLEPPAAYAFPSPPPQPLLEEDRPIPQAAAPEWRVAAPVVPASFIARAAGSSSRSESAPSPRPPRYAARLVSASLAYLRFALEHPGLYRMMYAPELGTRLASLGRALDPESPFAELREEKAKAFGVFVQLVREGQRAGEFRKEPPPEHVARLFTALAEGLAQQYLAEQLSLRWDRLKDAEELFELLLRAIGR